MHGEFQSPIAEAHLLSRLLYSTF